MEKEIESKPGLSAFEKQSLWDKWHEDMRPHRIRALLGVVINSALCGKTVGYEEVSLISFRGEMPPRQLSALLFEFARICFLANHPPYDVLIVGKTGRVEKGFFTTYFSLRSEKVPQNANDLLALEMALRKQCFETPVPSSPINAPHNQTDILPWPKGESEKKSLDIQGIIGHLESALTLLGR